MMSLKKALLGGLAIAITAACAFYYGYYTRTRPIYVEAVDPDGSRAGCGLL